MHKLTLKEIATATNGKIISGENEIFIDNIAIDSREAKENTLFVAICGENTDGHKYIDKAYENGATIVLTQKEELPQNAKGAILVDDTVKALGMVAKYYKSLFSIKTIAVTGSVGKTTTKDMLFSVMSTQYHTLKTEGNFNNEIGMPLTALRLNNSHEAAVFEMGMSAFGEIDYLAEIARPDIAVITNVGMSHIENLGSQEGIFKAKMEIANYFTKDNILVVNGDDEFLVKAKDTKKYQVITYGIENKDCDYLAYDIRNDGLSGTYFKTKIYDTEFTLHIKTPGVHNIYNALAAIICGVHYNISPQRIIEGIEEFSLTKMRMSVENANDITIINDCYNSSPDSVNAALKVLSTQKTRKVAVLGDILEMGDFAKDAHFNIGKRVVELGMDMLIAVGDNSQYICEGAKCFGMSEDKIIHFNTTDECSKAICDLLKPLDSVLVKASRGMSFEKIVDAIKR